MVGINNCTRFLTTAFIAATLTFSGIQTSNAQVGENYDLSSNVPQFIPSTCLDFSPALNSETPIIPAKTLSLKRQRMDAIIDIKSGCLIGDIDDNLRKVTDTASLAKLGTAMVVFDFLREGKDVKGNPLSLETKLIDIDNWEFNRWSNRHRKMIHFKSDLANDDMTLDDGLKYLLGLSVNQVGRAITNVIMGEAPTTQKEQRRVELNFMEIVNQRLRNRGLHNTHLINSNGLPGRDVNYKRERSIAPYSNTTTLEDLSKLIVIIGRYYPEFQRYTEPTYTVSEESAKIRTELGISLRGEFKSTSPLFSESYQDRLSKHDIDVTKTGTTNDAGRTMIAISGQLGIITHGHAFLDRHGEAIEDESRPERAFDLLDSGKELLQFEQKRRNEYEELVLLDLF